MPVVTITWDIPLKKMQKHSELVRKQIKEIIFSYKVLELKSENWTNVNFVESDTEGETTVTILFTKKSDLTKEIFQQMVHELVGNIRCHYEMIARPEKRKRIKIFMIPFDAEACAFAIED